MAKTSFIPPSVFLVIIGIIVLTSFAVRLLLPDEGPAASLPKAEEYQALLRNLNAADIFGEVNVNSAIDEEQSASILLSVSLANLPVYFVSDVKDPQINSFTTESLSENTLWQKIVDGTSSATPFTFGLDGIVYSEKATDEEGKVIASTLQEFDVQEKTSKDLTRVDHRSYDDEGYTDGIVDISYDAETKAVAFVVDRSVGSDKAHPLTDESSQEVYFYLPRSDSREQTSVERVDIATEVGEGWIRDMEYTFGTLFLLVQDAKAVDPNILLMRKGETWFRVVLPEQGRILAARSSSSLFVQSSNRDTLYEVNPLANTVIAHTDLTTREQWQSAPVLSDDGLAVYTAQYKRDGSGVERIERATLSDRTVENVVSGPYVPRAVLGSDHLLLENAEGERGTFSVYDREDGIRTPINGAGTLRLLED